MTSPATATTAVPFSASVVIATRNRPLDLRECLVSLANQTVLPLQAVIIDASDGDSTRETCAGLRDRLPFPLQYHRAAVRSSAAQRNEGAAAAQGDYVVFLDDDVVLEPDFLAEIRAVFAGDRTIRVAGVGGLVLEDRGSTQPTQIGAWLLKICAGRCPGAKAGRLVGPAMNFGPAPGSSGIQRVDWLGSGATTYRRHVFLTYRFPETFRGYSFMEDVHLSARIAKSYDLFITSRARVFHKALGKQTNTDWVALGRSMIVNRHAVMAYVMGRTALTDYLRLFAFELLYGTAGAIRAAIRTRSTAEFIRALYLLAGRIAGAVALIRGKSPHRPPQGCADSSSAFPSQTGTDATR